MARMPYQAWEHVAYSAITHYHNKKQHEAQAPALSFYPDLEKVLVHGKAVVTAGQFEMPIDVGFNFASGRCLRDRQQVQHTFRNDKGRIEIWRVHMCRVRVS